MHILHSSKFAHKSQLLEQSARYVDYWMEIEEPERSGCLNAFVSSKVFESTCVAVIVINSMFTIYTTNYMMSAKTEEQTFGMVVADRSFLGFYVLELVLKVSVHRLYFFCNNDFKWNWFDLALIILAAVDLLMVHAASGGGAVDMTFMRSFRLVKLSKILRMFRVLRFFSDLRLMLDCVAGSFLALLWCFVILGFFWVIFSLLFVQGMAAFVMENKNNVTAQEAADIESYFGSVEAGMMTLFQSITGGNDWSNFYVLVEKSGGINAALWVFYIIFFIFAACNIVTSIFIDKAMKLAQPDIETLLFEKQREDFSNARELKKLCCEVDRGDGIACKSSTITFKEFSKLMEDDRVRSYFELKGLAIKDAELFFQMLGSVSQTNAVDIDAFIAGCMKMKGFALSVDLLSLGFETKLISRAQTQNFAAISERLDMLIERLFKGGLGTNMSL